MSGANSRVNRVTALSLSLWPSALNSPPPLLVLLILKIASSTLVLLFIQIVFGTSSCLSGPLKKPAPLPISTLLLMCSWCPWAGLSGGGWFGIRKLISLQILLNRLGHRVELDMFQPLCANLPYDSSLGCCSVKKGLCFYKYINIMHVLHSFLSQVCWGIIYMQPESPFLVYGSTSFDTWKIMQPSSQSQYRTFPSLYMYIFLKKTLVNQSFLWCSLPIF